MMRPGNMQNFGLRESTFFEFDSADNAVKKRIAKESPLATLPGSGSNCPNISVISSLTQYFVSAGVAARSECDTGITDIMQRADAALYAAKNHGRNCIQVLAAEGSCVT
jgi:GGDEF domain-containing protein